MKISFGPDIYDVAMQALGPECDVVTFDAEDEIELDGIMMLVRKNKCDAIIKFGDVCDVGSEVD